MVQVGNRELPIKSVNEVKDALVGYEPASKITELKIEVQALAGSTALSEVEIEQDNIGIIYTLDNKQSKKYQDESDSQEESSEFIEFTESASDSLKNITE